jgi:hypothetical protein
MSQAAAAEDRGQIGLSDAAAADREYIKDELGLRDLQDAYRLAVAVALAKNLPPAAENLRRTTAYGAAVLDATGALRASVLALRDDHGGRPYALIERLAEAGLRDLAAHLNEGLPIRQYLAPLVPDVASEHPARTAVSDAGA